MSTSIDHHRPNPWVNATIVKLTPIRSGAPLAFFDVRFPLLEAIFAGCTLRRTKAGKLWCAPPKLRRVLSDGTTQYDDIITWDGGGPASRFSESCLEAIRRHAPDLLSPLLEGRAESNAQTRLLPHEPVPAVAPGWERDP